MEQLNRVELRGVVGNVKLHTFSDNRMARMTLATDYVFKDKEGNPVIDTSWHNVVAWEGKNIADLSTVEKGSKVHVVGRLRYQKYTGSDGVERISSEVVANMLEVLEDSEPLQREA